MAAYASWFSLTFCLMWSKTLRLILPVITHTPINTYWCFLCVLSRLGSIPSPVVIEQETDHDLLVGKDRPFRPPARLEANHAEPFEFGEFLVDVFHVAVDEPRGLADALGSGVGDGFEQRHRARIERLEQQVGTLEGEPVGVVNPVATAQPLGCVAAVAVEVVVALYRDEQCVGRCGVVEGVG